jgi:hypothetical protein
MAEHDPPNSQKLSLPFNSQRIVKVLQCPIIDHSMFLLQAIEGIKVQK